MSIASKRLIPIWNDIAISLVTVGINPLTAPSGLTLSVSNYHTIVATWTDNTASEEQYELQYKRTSDFSYSSIYLAADTETYTKTGLIGNTNYSFRVRALGPTTDYHSAWSSVVAATTYAYPDVNEMTFGSGQSYVSIR